MSEDPGFGVYVHWPYCRSICPYCDFNVYRRREADEDALLTAILADARAWRERTGPRRLRSAFFGGGTPSLLSPAAVGRVISTLAGLWDFAPDIEISLEANPEDVAGPGFADLAAAGVNRISLGVQSLDAAALARLGRGHDVPGAERAVARAQELFARVSMDLIAARAWQDQQGWLAELARALALGVEHLSIYQLTIEPGAAFAKRAARGEALAADADAAADLYEATQAACAGAGYPAYEVSNHARAPAARAAHNLIYWRSGEWAGLGPGAHGRLGGAGTGARLALIAARRPRDYIAAVARAGWGVVEAEPLSRAAQAGELLVMGLRLVEGVSLARAEAVAGAPIDAARMTALAKEGLIEFADGRLRAVGRGRLLIDRLAAELAPDAAEGRAAAGA